MRLQARESIDTTLFSEETHEQIEERLRLHPGQVFEAECRSEPHDRIKYYVFPSGPQAGLGFYLEEREAAEIPAVVLVLAGENSCIYLDNRTTQPDVLYTGWQIGTNPPLSFPDYLRQNGFRVCDTQVFSPTPPSAHGEETNAGNSGADPGRLAFRVWSQLLKENGIFIGPSTCTIHARINGTRIINDEQYYRLEMLGGLVRYCPVTRLWPDYYASWRILARPAQLPSTFNDDRRFEPGDLIRARVIDLTNPDAGPILKLQPIDGDCFWIHADRLSLVTPLA